MTVRFVKRAQELGFTLDEIAELLQLAQGGPQRCESARTLAEARITEIITKISELQRMRDSLQQLVATCIRPHAERECPLLEAIEAAPTRHQCEDNE